MFTSPPSLTLLGAGGHDTAAVLLDLLILFVAAKVLAEVFERLRQPAVVGEILAGVLVGPQVLRWVAPSEIITLLSELGVLFLLFSVGLETRASELRRVGKPALVAAAGGVAVPFLLGYVTMLIVGSTQVVALFVGTAMVATSVGITARVLASLGLLNVGPSRIVLGAAILDDILGLLVLAVVTSFAKGSVNLVHIVATVATSLAFVGVILAFGGRAMNRALPLIQRLRIAHSQYAGAIIFCLGLAVVAGWVGVAAIIGAFLAGTAFAEAAEETGLHHKVENITEFFLPFFLAFIGMQVELTSLVKPDVLMLCGVITALAVIGKLAGCGLPLLGQGKALALQVGWGMVPRGEVGIVVAQIGVSQGVLNADLYAVVLFMAVATTMIAPPAVIRAFRPLVGSQPEPGEPVVDVADPFGDLASGGQVSEAPAEPPPAAVVAADPPTGEAPEAEPPPPNAPA